MLPQKQFDLLYYLMKSPHTPTQHTISNALEIPVESVSRALREMEKKGYIKNGKLSALGRNALLPYKVENAIIMAAGKGTRFAPLTYEIPKGLIRIKGEVLIERQIRQLQEAGIKNITIVVGYMQEYFFYLEEKFHVKIVVNPDYYRYNNTSTLMAVASELGNTYVCSSDNYFLENVFTDYVYRTYYAAQYATGDTDEYCIRTDRGGRITDVRIGGSHSWYMLGQAYFSREFSRQFSEILQKEYKSGAAKHLLWEDVYIHHIKELTMYIKPYENHKIMEFDSLEDLRNFDFSYVDNVDSSIMDNICRVLRCCHKDITRIHILKETDEYAAFYFVSAGKKYIYLHPLRKSIAAHTDWKKSAFFLKLAKRLGLNGKRLHIDERQGWEVLAYDETVREADDTSASDIQSVIAAYRRLHEAKCISPYDFDIWSEIDHCKEKLERSTVKLPFDFSDMYHTARSVYDSIPTLGRRRRICYNACGNQGIFLNKAGQVLLEDWSHSGNSDPLCDVASYICGLPCSREQSLEIFTAYLKRSPSAKEQDQFIKYAAVAAFYWYLKAFDRDLEDHGSASLAYHYYQKFHLYAAKSLKRKNSAVSGGKDPAHDDTL
ncbi:MAG: NTP transferase domain-containing protein [Dialister sp.]|nr:NTP transferase domain-containing protein [Dialister sp.]